MTTPAPAPRFGADYRELVELGDGTTVLIRPIRPTDKPLLAEGFHHLSPESRYTRFLSAKSSLSPTELRYLTEVDGTDHFALAAIHRRPDGTDEGVGVARFIRMPDHPGVAEAAVTVVDELQGKGLGRALSERLVAAAVERGVRAFRCVMLAGNERARALIEEAVPALVLDSAIERTHDTLTFDVPLPEVMPEQALPSWRHPMRLLLAIAARATVAARHLVE